MRYTKPALTLDQQLERLRSRGLTITDTDRAIRWLSHIGYYRLSAYCLPFKDGETFRPNVCFDDIAGLYLFDRKLRGLVLDAIERIEVAIRAAIANEIAKEYGPFGHIEKRHFSKSKRFDHNRFTKELEKENGKKTTSETFVRHFRQKYSDEKHLPVWMAVELLSLGTVSKLYTALHSASRQRIAVYYGVDETVLRSWYHALTYLRNICAHHKRLWNRELAIKPKLPHNHRWQSADNTRLYRMLVVLRHMLSVVSPHCHWQRRLFELLDQHPGVSRAAMGIPPDWKTLTPWTSPD